MPKRRLRRMKRKDPVMSEKTTLKIEQNNSRYASMWKILVLWNVYILSLWYLDPRNRVKYVTVEIYGELSREEAK